MHPFPFPSLERRGVLEVVLAAYDLNYPHSANCHKGRDIAAIGERVAVLAIQ